MAHERFQMIRRDCWIEVTKKMPVPCVDTIVWRDQEFLAGWRTIPSYKNLWALLRERMARGESFAQTAIRQCRKSGLRIHTPHFIGVYPVKFPTRHDMTICMAAEWKSGTRTATNELSRCRWFETRKLHHIRTIGANCQKMLRNWKLKHKS